MTMNLVKPDPSEDDWVAVFSPSKLQVTDDFSAMEIDYPVNVKLRAPKEFGFLIFSVHSHMMMIRSRGGSRDGMVIDDFFCHGKLIILKCLADGSKRVWVPHFLSAQSYIW